MLRNSSGGVSLESYLAPSGERVLAGSGLDEFQRLAPEPVVVTSPSILTHTKEPHLRSSNLNFFSPTITVKQMAEQHSFTSSRSTLHKNKLRRLLVCLPKTIIQNIRQSLYDRFLSSDLIIAELMERRCFKQSGITNDLL